VSFSYSQVPNGVATKSGERYLDKSKASCCFTKIFTNQLFLVEGDALTAFQTRTLWHYVVN